MGCCNGSSSGSATAGGLRPIGVGCCNVSSCGGVAEGAKASENTISALWQMDRCVRGDGSRHCLTYGSNAVLALRDVHPGGELKWASRRPAVRPALFDVHFWLELRLLELGTLRPREGIDY